VKVFWIILFTVVFFVVSPRTHEASMNTGDRGTHASSLSLGLSSASEFVDIPEVVAQSGEGVWRPTGALGHSIFTRTFQAYVHFLGLTRSIRLFILCR
jgi:hypothetical protein